MEELEQEEPEESEDKVYNSNEDDNLNAEAIDFTIWTRFSETHPQYNTHQVHMCIEAKAKVPDFIGGALPRKDKGNYEDYCMTMLTLFKPWHTGKDLRADDSTWNDTFLGHIFTERQSELIKFFHIRYECNDARDDFAAARKKGIPTSDLPSNIDADLQEYLDNLYYGNESLSELTDAQLSEIAGEYNEWSRGYIVRLSKMQNAETYAYYWSHG